MELNITVFVQVIHFIIAYFLLEHLFFRPAFCFIQERDCDLKELQDTLVVQTQQVVLTREQAEESRLGYQKRLAQTAPAPSVIRSTVECSEVETMQDGENVLEEQETRAHRVLSPKQEQEIIDLCKQRLLRKIL